MGERHDSDSEERVTPWQGINYGLLCLAVGVVLFLLLGWMEESGRGGRVHWLVAITYYIGGKWAVAGLFGLAGTISFVLRIALIIKTRSESCSEC